MKKRYEQWQRLTGNAPPAAANFAQPPIRMLDFPDFQRMEDKILINPPDRGTLSPDVEAFAKFLSEKTFGITENDTLFEDPVGYDDLPEWSEERHAIDDLYHAHEDQFETADSTDDEAVAILLKLGMDFRDARGQPLRCTKLFCRQAEAVAKGIMGKMPDRTTAGLESWAKALERDAHLHMGKKRSA